MSAAPAGHAAIEVAGLRKSWETRDGSVVALEDVTFSVGQGEFVSVLGPSGCGKTTLLRAIAGLDTPSSGSVSIQGTRVTGPQRQVGIVFQVTALMRWRNVRDNVMYPAEIIGLDRASSLARAADLLRLVGLGDAMARYPHELSGGMQQRVGIARALLHDPRILLLDEPFSALDTMTRNQLNLELLRIWSESRKASLLITHSIAEAVFLSDRIVVLSPRPTTVLDVVPVDLPRPRTTEMRVSPAFLSIVEQIGRRIGLEYV